MKKPTDIYENRDYLEDKIEKMKKKQKDVLDLIDNISIKLVKERDDVYNDDGHFKRPIVYLHGEKAGLDRGLDYLQLLKKLIKLNK